MPLSISDLFARGAQRTIEYLLTSQESEVSIAQAKAALERRFGSGEVSTRATLELYQSASQALLSARSFELGRPSAPENYGLNPQLRTPYSYTAIAELSDPLRPGQTVSIPYTVYSDQPLTPQQIKDQTAAAVLEYTSQPERGDSNQQTAMQRRDTRFMQERLTQQSLGENPAQNLDITIVSAYRNQ